MNIKENNYMSPKEKVHDLQLRVLKCILFRQLETAFSSADASVEAIYNAAKEKKDSWPQNGYAELYAKWTAMKENGEEILQPGEDIDVTLASALLNYDFVNLCKIPQSISVNTWRAKIRLITASKNSLISHLKSYDDKEKLIQLMTSAADDLGKLLQHLEHYWTNPDGVEEVKHFKDKLVEIQDEIQEMAEGNTDRFAVMTALLDHFQRQIHMQDEIAGRFVELSYNRADWVANEENKFSLNRLMQMPENEKGFVLCADAGYGKTWTMLEIAGRLSRIYDGTDDNALIPLYFPICQLDNVEAPIRTKLNHMIFSRETFLSRGREDVSYFLRENRVCLILDAMDEACTEVKEKIETEITNLLSEFPKLKIIGSSRSSDVFYFDSMLPRYHIYKLDDRQLEQFIEKHILPEKLNYAKEILSNPNCFIHAIRTPFYLKCFTEYVNAISVGEFRIHTEQKLVACCMEMMIQREIDVKRLHIRKIDVTNVLKELRQTLGDKQEMEVQEAVDRLTERMTSYRDRGTGISDILYHMDEADILDIFEMQEDEYVKFAHDLIRANYVKTFYERKKYEL